MLLDITVSEIKLPPMIKKHGRPKGAELDLLKKKQKKLTCTKLYLLLQNAQ